MSQMPADPAGKKRRRFHSDRPERGAAASLRQHSQPNQKFRPLPAPTGPYPYHLSLDQVLPSDLIRQINASGRIVFQAGGDTGGVRSPQPQQLVAMKMEEQFNLPNPADRPAFFYHLGDLVYYYGEMDQWYPQFYEPYGHYPAPIFAIPGNHDGDVLDGTTPSLAGFVENLCAAEPHLTNQAGDVPRDAMTQPHVYWTLEAPFVTIIGLYTNVPASGEVDDTQMAWLISELKNAPREKAIILTAHHPPYSADAHHGGSLYMKLLIDRAANEAGRMPDMIMGGHIHNYQRFTRKVGHWDVPYVVAGASGYWHLHYMADQPDGTDLPVPYTVPDSDVVLENYHDRRHGFLRLVVAPQAIIGEYFTVPRPQESWRAPVERTDFFTLNLNSHQLIR